jgi:hypothetical protein
MAARKSAANTSSTGGRRRKDTAASRAQIAKNFAELDISERQQMELLSIVSELFAQGYNLNDVSDLVLERFPDSYASLLRGEKLWDLLREAAERRLFRHTPRDDFKLYQKLIEDYPWLNQHATVVQTATTSALAEHAATKLLDMIRTVRKHKQCDEVHVGFAGGMTLRAVAEKLSQLLGEPHHDNPVTLVFHAMVAGFDDDDFYADPNSFITYFISSECRVKVRLVRLPLPGIIETDRYADLRTLSGVDRVFQRRDEIQIIVTSGSLWSDEYSTLRTYMKAAFNDSQRRSGGGPVDATQSEDYMQQLDTLGVVGDLLWQPINSTGAVQLDSAYQVATLMGLDELPAFINRGGSVLLVMGCSGISGLPKSELLKTILDLHQGNQHRSAHKWLTDMVTDTPTVEGIYFPDARHRPAPAHRPCQPR